MIGAVLPYLMLPPASGVPGWSGPTIVTPTNDSNLHYSAATAQDNLGNVYLFWDQNPGIYYVVTNTGQIASNSWPTPSLYTRSNNLDISPSPVALKNGTLILFFSSKRANQYNIYYSRSNDQGVTWSSETQLTTSAASDQAPNSMQDPTGKIWLSWTRQEAGDIHLKFVDSNGNGVWDPGESIVYDSNGSNIYDTGDIVIAGSTPTLGSVLSIDTRIGFIDAYGTGLWRSGDLVIYDPNGDSTFDPKFMYLDSDNNNVWDPSETIVYKANSTSTTFGGTGRCVGNTPPTTDCVIIGSNPPSTTILKTDPHIKFVDLNGDSVWELGETLVYDVNSGVNNNSGKYASNDPAIAALTSDSNLKYIGPGSTWTSGNTIVYDSNGNTVYDGGIMYVDDNFTNHWVKGDTVVYHPPGSVDTYGFSDILIAGTSNDFGRQLKNDPGLRFFDINGNGLWDQGEAVVYDPNRNGIYDGNLKYARTGTNTTWVNSETVVWDSNGDAKYTTGKYYNDTIVAGSPLANNTALYIDSLLKFVDTNGNMARDNGESVVYDANNNNLFDTGETVVAGAAPLVGTGLTTGLGEPVVAYSAPAVGSSLVNDTKLRYVKSGTNTTWVTGESLVYDSNGNGMYDPSEPVISGTTPAPGTSLLYDPLVRFRDSNGNGVWDSAEAIVYDALNKGTMQTGYSQYDLIRGITVQSGTGLAYNIGEPWPYGSTPPVPGTMLKFDGLVKFVDLNGNGHWDTTGLLSSQISTGEPVEYDTNNNGVYDAGTDIVITGSPVPQIGTGLKTDEMNLAGTTVPAGTKPLVTDSKIKFVPYGTNTTWVPGETVVWDRNNDGKYSIGKFNNDTIIAGTAPLNNTSLSIDSKLKYFDANRNGQWDPGERVFYDANNDGVYEANENVVALFPAPSHLAVLASDPKIKYFETASDTHWDQGESVVYDVNSTGTFKTGDIVISGAVPSVGSILSADTKLKFVDNLGTGVWAEGENVVYDNNSDGLYEYTGLTSTTEPVLNSLPSPGAPLQSVTHIFYKTYNGASWSSDQRLTTQPYIDRSPVIKRTEDGRIWILWSAQRPGGPNNILYRTSLDGVTWIPEAILTSSPSSFGDNDPSLLQDRNGTLWLAFSRNLPASGNTPFQADVFTMYSTNNGLTWTSPTDRTNTTGTNEIMPEITQLSDKNLYIFYSLLSCGGSTCTVVLDYFKSSSQVLIHDANMNKFTTNATFSPTYGYNIRMGQILRLNGNVTNGGDFSDTFQLTAKANSTIVSPSNSSTVLIGQTKIIFIDWRVSTPRPGRYVITANITDTSGTEGMANLLNNTATFTVLVRPAGDVNGDCVVDVSDLALVGAAFGKSRGQPGYNSMADLNNDGVIDVADLAIVGGTFGQTC